ncbi:type I toxin-antitoxin system Fst family toxin [Staphylococcus hominis]
MIIAPIIVGVILTLFSLLAE